MDADICLLPRVDCKTDVVVGGLVACSVFGTCTKRVTTLDWFREARLACPLGWSTGGAAAVLNSWF